MKKILYKSENIGKFLNNKNLFSSTYFRSDFRQISSSFVSLSWNIKAVRGIDSQRRMAEHKRLNTFLLIALHMSWVLHPSFFSQVHTVNTHVFNIGASFYIHFKDISNTAIVQYNKKDNLCFQEDIRGESKKMRLGQIQSYNKTFLFLIRFCWNLEKL